MAGPAVTVVAKIQSASSADSGTATIAMIFARIDQLRLLIKLRPRVRQQTISGSAVAADRAEGTTSTPVASAGGRIRNEVHLS
ncbi:hypothetical protein GCM10025331_05410 [Actinoplanes utahensis]|nr:hypothetical protein Aut01nite_12670 [Actinoplanes utahensis]